ncbi:MAG TPA: hypothetical protein VNF08_07845 [Acidimicrobiales bacterium]|nr:hypothetical protein [Acidimicrobiales bacterium]
MRGIELKPLARHLLRHPALAPVVVRAAWGLRATKWWRRTPFLPLPDRAYWDFRLVTANGSTTRALSVDDVGNFAKWSRLQRVGR